MLLAPNENPPYLQREKKWKQEKSDRNYDFQNKNRRERTYLNSFTQTLFFRLRDKHPFSNTSVYKLRYFYRESVRHLLPMISA